MHNYYRALHNSPPLKCDPELATSAQRWTDQQAADGKMYNSEWTDKFTESISWKGWGWEGMWKMEGAIPGAVRSWYSEIKNSNYNYKTGKASSTVGHFQAVVWKGETKLGCGLASKPNDGAYVTAHYAPPSHTSMDREKQTPQNVKPRKRQCKLTIPELRCASWCKTLHMKMSLTCVKMNIIHMKTCFDTEAAKGDSEVSDLLKQM